MAAGLQLKYFVLSPSKKDIYGEASRQAITIYSNCIKEQNPELSADLRQWVLQLEKDSFA